MPEIKFSMGASDYQMVAEAAKSAALPVASWVRSTALVAARQLMPKPEAEKPAKLTAAERKRLERFEDKLRSIANDLDCKGHVGQFLVMKMADLHLSAELKAFYAEFMDWCLADGHVDEAALEEGQKLHEQRQARHAEQREKMRSVKATRVFLPEK